MTYLIKTKNQKQEKYLLAFLESIGAEFEQTNDSKKKKVERKKSLIEFVSQWTGVLKGAENIQDEKVQRILSKHK